MKSSESISNEGFLYCNSYFLLVLRSEEIQSIPADSKLKGKWQRNESTEIQPLLKVIHSEDREEKKFKSTQTKVFLDMFWI